MYCRLSLFICCLLSMITCNLFAECPCKKKKTEEVKEPQLFLVFAGGCSCEGEAGDDELPDCCDEEDGYIS